MLRPTSPARLPGRLAISPCRLCSRPLAALERLRGDICAASTCRLAAARERARARRDADLAARRASAARRWQDDTVVSAPLLWLERHETTLVPLAATARRAHAEHLAALAQGLQAAPAPDADPGPPLPSDDTPLAPALCGFCGGRCCRYGAATHAFITPALLQRWLQRHPGATPTDAAAAYLALLPRHHVEQSCLHHGRAGCTLPQEMRSDICNRYACGTLRQLQDQTAGTAAVVVAMDRADTLGPAALLQSEGARVLPRLPVRRP